MFYSVKLNQGYIGHKEYISGHPSSDFHQLGLSQESLYWFFVLPFDII